jgi:hypothetical protein
MKTGSSNTQLQIKQDLLNKNVLKSLPPGVDNSSGAYGLLFIEIGNLNWL